MLLLVPLVPPLPLVAVVARAYDRCHVTYARATSGSMYVVTCFDSCHVTAVKSVR